MTIAWEREAQEEVTCISQQCMGLTRLKRKMKNSRCVHCHGDAAHPIRLHCISGVVSRGSLSKQL